MGVENEMKIVRQKWSTQEKRMPAIFLDRDGTLIEGRKVLASLDEVRLLSGVSEGLKKMQRAGYLLVVVTNQPNIERGDNTEKQILAQNDRLRALLSETGITLDAAYACPHKYPSTCTCRKPELGMIVQAQEDFEIDMSRSWFIGDTGRDMETGARAGLRTIKLKGDDLDTHFKTVGDFSAVDISAAAEII